MCYKNIDILYFAICNFDFRKVLIIYVRLQRVFYGTEVLTGKHYFQSNEILTACLNLRTGDLRAILEELKFLRQKIQLPEELDIEFNENYDRYVQQAQNLLFKIGRLAKRIPLYRDDHSFDAPQLMDCLNRFSLWDSNIGLEPDVDYYSSDYADEVGFSVTDEDGHATFYHQHFSQNRNSPRLTRQKFYWFFATATMQQPRCLTAISHSFRTYCACRLLMQSFWRIICTRSVGF